MKILVSRCLLGINCKYNGGNNYTKSVVALAKDPNNEVISICPETMGGLPMPRVPSEIDKDGVVYSKDGESVDAEFRLGAQKCLEIAQRVKPDLCILKSKSPSCGVHKRYDGTFQGRLIEGAGVTAQLLMENGFRCVEPEELGDLGM